MIKILFICHGNICRSPMAEYMLKDYLEKHHINHIYVESRATSTEEIWKGIGNPVYPPAKLELSKHGISYDDKHAKQITKEDCDQYDYLICMDHNNLRNMHYMFGNAYNDKISLLMSYANKDKDVADPWYTGDFTKTYNDIYEGIVGLMKVLG